MPKRKTSDIQRARLAQTAARLMVEQGIRDFRLAKEKAAQRLGVSLRTGQLPKNTEIELAVAERQRLFAADSQPVRLAALRRAAVDAMRLFAEFRPRLVGDVLSGLADENSDVHLHAFAEHSESFDVFLHQQGIPFELAERRFRFGRGEYRYYPAFRFYAGDIGIEVVLFPERELRQAPNSLVDGLPMTRAKLAQVERLLPRERDLV